MKEWRVKKIFAELQEENGRSDPTEDRNCRKAMEKVVSRIVRLGRFFDPTAPSRLRTMYGEDVLNSCSHAIKWFLQVGLKYSIQATLLKLRRLRNSICAVQRLWRRYLRKTTAEQTHLLRLWEAEERTLHCRVHATNPLKDVFALSEEKKRAVITFFHNTARKKYREEWLVWDASKVATDAATGTAVKFDLLAARRVLFSADLRLTNLRKVKMTCDCFPPKAPTTADLSPSYLREFALRGLRKQFNDRILDAVDGCGFRHSERSARSDSQRDAEVRTTLHVLSRHLVRMRVSQRRHCKLAAMKAAGDCATIFPDEAFGVGPIPGGFRAAPGLPLPRRSSFFDDDANWNEITSRRKALEASLLRRPTTTLADHEPDISPQEVHIEEIQESADEAVSASDPATPNTTQDDTLHTPCLGEEDRDPPPLDNFAAFGGPAPSIILSPTTETDRAEPSFEPQGNPLSSRSRESRVSFVEIVEPSEIGDSDVNEVIVPSRLNCKAYRTKARYFTKQNYIPQVASAVAKARHDRRTLPGRCKTPPEMCKAPDLAAEAAAVGQTEYVPYTAVYRYYGGAPCYRGGVHSPPREAVERRKELAGNVYARRAVARGRQARSGSPENVSGGVLSSPCGATPYRNYLREGAVKHLSPSSRRKRTGQDSLVARNYALSVPTLTDARSCYDTTDTSRLRNRFFATMARLKDQPN